MPAQRGPFSQSAAKEVFTQRLETQSAVRPMTQWMRTVSKEESHPRFVIPTPCYETAASLGNYSGQPVYIARNDILPSEVRGQDVILITGRDCEDRPIEGFAQGDMALAHGYWRVYRQKRPS